MHALLIIIKRTKICYFCAYYYMFVNLIFIEGFSLPWCRLINLILDGLLTKKCKKEKQTRIDWCQIVFSVPPQTNNIESKWRWRIRCAIDVHCICELLQETPEKVWIWRLFHDFTQTKGIATKGTDGTALGPFSIQVCALKKLVRRGMRIPAS